jgi:hypothetical protein
MIGRKAVIGLSLLSALLFCAVVAQSAAAAAATNTTAFTCVKQAGGKFNDAHCDNKVSGEFEHVAISGTTEKVAATNENVTNETKSSEPAVLKGTVPGGKTQIECTKVKNEVENSSLTNSESEKKHKLTGKARTEFSTCTVVEPKKCTVKEPIVSNATVEGLEGLTGPKGEANAMGGEFKGSGLEETFAEITYEGAECALKGQTFKVKGSAIATSGPTTESAQNNQWSGATLVFTPKFSMQTLKLGANAAEFSGIFTSTMSGGNPIALTTVT